MTDQNPPDTAARALSKWLRNFLLFYFHSSREFRACTQCEDRNVLFRTLEASLTGVTNNDKRIHRSDATLRLMTQKYASNATEAHRSALFLQTKNSSLCELIFRVFKF